MQHGPRQRQDEEKGRAWCARCQKPTKHEPLWDSWGARVTQCVECFHTVGDVSACMVKAREVLAAIQPSVAC